MEKSVALFEIWDEKFSTSSQKGGLFKIHFKNFPNHCLLRRVSGIGSGNFEKKLNEEKAKIWKIYQGLSVKQTLNQGQALKQNQYKKMSSIEREVYDQKISDKRQVLIENLISGNLEYWDEDYIKMFIFMELNNLNLKDLCFEILLVDDPKLSFLQTNAKETKIWKKYELGFKIFDVDYSMINRFFHQFSLNDELPELKEMRKIVLEKTENSYVQWICWWKLYQIFEVSFLKMIGAWLISCKEVSIEKIKQGFEATTTLMINQANLSLIYSSDTYGKNNLESFLRYSQKNKNGELILKNFKDCHVQDLIKIEEWVFNDQINFLSDFLRYKFWNDQYFKFWGTWKEICEFFESNPFNNTPGFNEIVKPAYQNFMRSVQLLKTPKSVLNAFHVMQRAFSLDEDEPQIYQNPFLQHDIIFDYYFRINHLNMFLF